MSEFRFYAFVTAQEWGYGPQQWTPELLQHDADLTIAGRPLRHSEDRLASGAVSKPNLINPPSGCRWTVHLPEGDNSDDFVGLEDEWPSQWKAVHTEQELQNALKTSSFSNVPESQLPLSVPQIARLARPSAHDLLIETVAFAIMGRNLELLKNCLDEVDSRDLDITPLYPFHLATTYLDGATTCCLIMDELCCFFSNPKRPKTFRECQRNRHGHTILDNILLTILRSHADVPLVEIDRALGKTAAYAGIEVDICGRWSANTPCFRALAASGQSWIPKLWKHKFCHTSTQAVCHCLTTILLSFEWASEDQSHLFMHTCLSCDARLQLGPLHALVVAAFLLVKYGFEDEDLFGMLACYLRMVSEINHCNPLDCATISIDLLLNRDVEGLCSHEYMTASVLAQHLTQELDCCNASPTSITGWHVLVRVMETTESAVGQSKSYSTSVADDREDGSFDNHSVDDVAAEASIEFDHLDTISGGMVLHHAIQLGVPEDRDATNEDAFTISDDYGWSAIDDHQEVVETEHSTSRHYSFTRTCGYCGHLPDDEVGGAVFGNSIVLGHVWAAVQAEVANHKRLSDSDTWLSPYFSMQGLLEWLEAGTEPVTYIKEGMLKGYCACSCFDNVPVLLGEDMLKDYCAPHRRNREADHRALYIPAPKWQ